MQNNRSKRKELTRKYETLRNPTITDETNYHKKHAWEELKRKNKQTWRENNKLVRPRGYRGYHGNVTLKDMFFQICIFRLSILVFFFFFFFFFALFYRFWVFFSSLGGFLMFWNNFKIENLFVSTEVHDRESCSDVTKVYSGLNWQHVGVNHVTILLHRHNVHFWVHFD